MSICFHQTKSSLITLIVLSILSFNAIAEEKIQMTPLPSGDEITSTVYGHNNKTRILWLSSSYGLQPRHMSVAKNMAASGMQVWLTSLPESLFLPKGARTMRSITPSVVADLIEALSEKGRYEILIISSGYGGIPALRGIHAWQGRKQKLAKLNGLILFSPYFYASLPTLGNAPDLIPELTATNIPIYIFQGEKNANRWHLPDMLTALQQNAPVYVEILKGVTALFYDGDAAPESLTMIKNIVPKIRLAAARLKNHEVPLMAIPLLQRKHSDKGSGLNTKLTPYTGKIKPSLIELNDVNGKKIRINNYKGKVTLINFWATWCTPCVEEIPSLNRLKEKMKGKPFQLISINYAESSKQVKKFMQKVSVNFPVLIDPEGQLAGQWKVVAFPSTFVIGPNGEIKYGVNAAIHWDTDKIIQQLNALND